jgi:hypothetical protein
MSSDNHFGEQNLAEQTYAIDALITRLLYDEFVSAERKPSAATCDRIAHELLALMPQSARDDEKFVNAYLFCIHNLIVLSYVLGTENGSQDALIVAEESARILNNKIANAFSVSADRFAGFVPIAIRNDRTDGELVHRLYIGHPEFFRCETTAFGFAMKPNERSIEPRDSFVMYRMSNVCDTAIEFRLAQETTTIVGDGGTWKLSATNWINVLRLLEAVVSHVRIVKGEDVVAGIDEYRTDDGGSYTTDALEPLSFMLSNIERA